MALLRSVLKCSLLRHGRLRRRARRLQDGNNRSLSIKQNQFYSSSDNTVQFLFMQLNAQSAPQFLHFGPKTTKLKPADHFELTRVGFGAEQIAKWVNDRTKINVRHMQENTFSPFILLSQRSSKVSQI